MVHTFNFAEVKGGFLDSEVDVEWGDLFSEDEEVFNQEKLTVKRRLNEKG